MRYRHANGLGNQFEILFYNIALVVGISSILLHEFARCHSVIDPVLTGASVRQFRRALEFEGRATRWHERKEALLSIEITMAAVLVGSCRRVEPPTLLSEQHVAGTLLYGHTAPEASIGRPLEQSLARRAAKYVNQALPVSAREQAGAPEFECGMWLSVTR